jgi:hypothetical protein
LAFGSLSLRSASSIISEATSTPDDGINTIGLGFKVENADNFEMEIVANGPSITDVSWTEPVAGDSSVAVTFTQNGTDTATIIARQIHSSVR